MYQWKINSHSLRVWLASHANSCSSDNDAGLFFLKLLLPLIIVYFLLIRKLGANSATRWANVTKTGKDGSRTRDSCGDSGSVVQSPKWMFGWKSQKKKSCVKVFKDGHKETSGTNVHRRYSVKSTLTVTLWAFMMSFNGPLGLNLKFRNKCRHKHCIWNKMWVWPKVFRLFSNVGYLIISVLV